MDRDQLRRVKRHLMSWATGEHGQVAVPGAGVATIGLEDRAHLPALDAAGLVGASTVVLAPGDLDDPDVTGYGGSLAQPGSELALGDEFFLQTQDYASSAYLSVLGPTIVRISDAEDLETFLADADRARDHGVFPDFLTAPAVRPADVPALGAAVEGDGPRMRLHVGQDGAVSTSPGGLPLGRAGDSLAQLEDAWRRANRASAVPCGVCLARVVPEQVRAELVGGRPSLARYLAVLDVLRTLTVNEIGGLRISGFGGRLGDLPDGADGADLGDPTLPVLAWNDDRAFVVDRGRVFGVDATAARVAECLLALGSVEAAGRLLPGAQVARVAEFFAAHGVALVPGRTAVAG